MLKVLEVWFYRDGIANILSLSQLVDDGYNISFDCKQNKFVLTTSKGEKIEFIRSPEGLYYYDLTANEDAIVLVETVAENMEGYSRREIEAAKQARDGQELVGFPSERDYETMVRGGLVRNCPINIHDVRIARHVFGPDVNAIKGKTTRRTHLPVVSDYIHIPTQIYQRNHRIVVVADVMFVSGLKFLVTVSRGIDLTTTEYLPSGGKKYLGAGLKKSNTIIQ